MAVTTDIDRETLVTFLLRLADDHLILGHRLSEWCGHAPMLEEDLVLPKISLDLLGQARSLYSYAGEIEGAGHASATGRFDDEQLFYLRSRGIDETEARRLVIHGFFHDLIRKIDVPVIEARLYAAVEAELAATMGALVGEDA